MSQDFYQDIDEKLSEIHKTESFRRVTAAHYSVPIIRYEGRGFINFSSNDYLGIAYNSTLREEFIDQHPDLCFGSTGSRLITGNDEAYLRFEQFLENIYRRPALIYNSGYHANTGIIPSLCFKGDLIIADKLVHRSIIDGMMGSGAEFERFRHLDYEHLESILIRKRHLYRHIWVISESIFSMDGDMYDLERLIALRSKYSTLLYIDQAHSIGVSGDSGLGISPALLSQIDILASPMGKALGSQGAFVLCRQTVKDYLINKSSTMIFSTALPPACVEWSHFVFEKMMRMDSERTHLAKLGGFLRAKMEINNIETLGTTHIVPIMLYDNIKCVHTAELLRQYGIWTTAIRHPTVAHGQARIRISLSSTLNEEHIDHLAHILTKIRQ